MELEDADKVSKSAKRPKGKKLYLINYKVEESTELFLPAGGIHNDGQQ